jgi:hypothetical protein
MAGPVEQLGPLPFMALGWTLVAVCVLDVVAGGWLWQGRRRGLQLGVATNACAFALGLGFALPLLIAGVPLRAVLALGKPRRSRPVMSLPATTAVALILGFAALASGALMYWLRMFVAIPKGVDVIDTAAVGGGR